MLDGLSKVALDAVTLTLSEVSMAVDFDEARTKYCEGGRLTNEELQCLYWYYQNVYTTVSANNEPAYKLVWKDAFSKAVDLERMIDARNNNITTAVT